MDDTDNKFEGWAILELMGHRRLAGYITTQEVAGHAFLRIDVPTDPPATQLYSGGAVYCITPATEETARKAANLGRVAPVSRWELPPPPAARHEGEYGDPRTGDDELNEPLPGMESAPAGAAF